MSSLPWIIRPATPDDLAAIEALRRKDGGSLGFIPKARYEHIVFKTLDRGRRRWIWERLIVCVDNEEITGFVLANIGRKQAKIEQVCVRQDARRMERALCLCEVIEIEAEHRGLPRIRCRVAVDIEANWYWTAAGYEVIETVNSSFLNIRESKSKRALFVYEKTFAKNVLFS